MSSVFGFLDYSYLGSASPLHVQIEVYRGLRFGIFDFLDAECLPFQGDQTGLGFNQFTKGVNMTEADKPKVRSARKLNFLKIESAS